MSESCYESIGNFNDNKVAYVNKVSDPVVTGKLNEILKVVYRMDRLLLHQASIVPVLPEKPDSIKPHEPPPPRPPKDHAVLPFPKKSDSKDKKKGESKTFSYAECEFLYLQVKQVMKFLDNEIEDMLTEKEENMVSLQTLLSALKPPKL